MTFCLRQRATYEPLSITHCLSLKAPRLSTPPQWHWSWPLESIAGDNAFANSANQSTIRHVWISTIRAVAVADDATLIAFVSQHGAVSLSRLNSELPPTPIVAPVHLLPTASDQWCRIATSVCFFQLQLSSPENLRTILAIGYTSGAVSFFDTKTANMLAVVKLHPTLPVRRLRYYPTFHQASTSVSYPSVSSNCGLFAVLAWSGTVVRLPANEISSLVSTPSNSFPVVDAHGAGCVVWNLSEQDAVVDAMVCGSAPSFICEQDESPPSAALRIVAVGVNPPVAAYSVSENPAFSARAAAARVANSFMSAARGFIMSRIGSKAESTISEADELREAITGDARHTASWTDDSSVSSSFLKMPDVRGTARKAFSGNLRDSLQRRLYTTGSRDQPPARSGSAPDEKALANERVLADKTASFSRTRTAYFSKVKSTSTTNDTALDNSVVRRKSSSLINEDVLDNFSNSARKLRIITRAVVAPHPYSLLASCDSLGRIFILDPHDLCVLRVLKGYRDANVAWFSDDGLFLVVQAPRLDVVELHGSFDPKRSGAFRVLPGTILVQTTCHKVFCVFPDGRLFEIVRSLSTMEMRSDDKSSQESSFVHKSNNNDVNGSVEQSNSVPSINDIEGRTSDYELVGKFTEAVKRDSASQAIECLQYVEEDYYKVTHLMATLVSCMSNVRPDVHIALASKAEQVASKLQNPDLVCRFEAHRRLAEAFQLIKADIKSIDPSTDRLRSSKYGPRLSEDDLGSDLSDFGMRDAMGDFSGLGFPLRLVASELEFLNCERFILSHQLVPAVDAQMDYEYIIQPRSDLSHDEQKLLAMTFYAKLLELDSVNVPTAGREHPTAAEIFLALDFHLGLSQEEITRGFVKFFLHAPLVFLLNTHVSIYASPLQCVVARICSQFSSDIVDPIIIDSCESTTRVANAVLLVRLCALHGDEALTDDCSNPYLELLDRLNEALVYHKITAGSNVVCNEYEQFTARRFYGVRGDGERHAVTSLIEANDYNRAMKIFNGMDGTRKMDSLSVHEAASVSEAALQACRKKCVGFIQGKDAKTISENVVAWIRAGQSGEAKTNTLQTGKNRLTCLYEIRAVLLAAHAFIPDSSIDAVRTMQLAEAMSALIKAEIGKNTDTVNENADSINDHNLADEHKKTLLEEMNDESILASKD